MGSGAGSTAGRSHTPARGQPVAHPTDRPPPAAADPDHAEAPTALLLSLPFWFCQCGRRPAARKATACTDSCTWWHTRSPASGIRTEWVPAAVRGSPTVPRMNNDPALISQARQQFYNGKVGPPTVNPAPRGTTGAPNRSTTGYARSAGTATTGPTSGKHR